MSARPPDGSFTGRRPKRVPREVERAVRIRAEGRCERCGKEVPTELHHRRFRSRGGEHTASNLVALCGWGNHTGCHGFAHSDDPHATLQGWAVSAWGREPHEIGIPHAVYGWVTLTDRGTVIIHDRAPTEGDEHAEG